MRVCGQGDVVWPMTMWIWQRKWHRGRQLWQLLWMIKITIDCETSDQWHSILAAVIADGLRGYSDTSLCQFPLFTLFGYVSIVSLCQSARSCSTQRTPGEWKTEILRKNINITSANQNCWKWPTMIKVPLSRHSGASWLPSWNDWGWRRSQETHLTLSIMDIPMWTGFLSSFQGYFY